MSDRILENSSPLDDAIRFQDRITMSAVAAAVEKGSGVLMVCTFGDSTDVDWWRSEDLPRTNSGKA